MAMLLRFSWAMLGPVMLAASAGCGPDAPGHSSSAPLQLPGPASRRGSDFAKDRLPEKPIDFDKKRVMEYLQQICDLGPRISGTKEMEKLQAMLTKHFEAHGGKVELQRFKKRQRSQEKETPMANLIARWNPDAKRRIILCAHYDTRPRADEEPDPRDQVKPFLGANDGGVGPALMMELAHHLKDLDLKVGLDFVLFDAEEFIWDNRPEERGGDWYFLGSHHFAERYAEARRKHRDHPEYVAAVLVDLIGGKDARFPYEQYSFTQAGHLVKEIWGIAKELKIDAFVEKMGTAVRDDHLPLLDVGIPAINIIDFSYPHWHRLSDVPANCSAESIEKVARVVWVWMQRAK